MCVSEFQPEFFPDQDKKLSLQPDVTATSVPACYEYPFDPKLSMSRSLSEHHYDVPHLSIAPQPSLMSPTPSTSTQESCSDKQIHSDSENSVTSSYPSSDSTYNVASESVRLPKLEAGNVARAAVNTRGALLVLPDSGISMSVPEGAVPKPLREELYLAVLNEDRYRPRLPGECKLFMALRAAGGGCPELYDRSCEPSRCYARDTRDSAMLFLYQRHFAHVLRASYILCLISRSI